MSRGETQQKLNLKPYKELITFAEDRAGHDRRYANRYNKVGKYSWLESKRDILYGDRV